MATRINETDKGFYVAAQGLEIVECPPGAKWPVPAAGVADRKSVADNWLREVQSYNDAVYLTKKHTNFAHRTTWIAVEKVSANEFGEVAP